ncbi:DUF1441 family protein [Buttiauxella sp. 3AFRM03]|uniref:DUF1441 family protein n=1 Tax=Buttiauxella sp. 3AFRM03 TaxID=2479367 RepID=UPI000EF7F908|nr:DUF1441 family protein [Buttiauxella sp. 3AFRM03]AYN29995.1 DUF1441 family protein [Buttiauxella sp. 3AFRM03]
MDQELKNLQLSIAQLAALSGMHRQTVSARLKNIPPTGGNGSNLTLYSLTSVIGELMRAAPPSDDDDMDAHERKAWYQSERERLKFEQETSQLIPASDVARDFAAIIKAVVQTLETLPDILERDCALTPSAVKRVQDIIDDLRDQMAQKIYDADDDKEEASQEE